MIFDLPEINLDSVRSHFKKIETELNKRQQKLGSGSDIFKRRKKEMLATVMTGGEIKNELRTSRDIRVIIELWREDNDFFKKVPVSLRILEKLKDIRDPLGVLATYSMTQLFFERFDEIDELPAIVHMLREQFNRMKETESYGELADIRRNYKKVIRIDAPKEIVDDGLKKGYELKVTLNSSGVRMEREGRFFQACKYRYYIKGIEGLKIGADSQILHEVIKDEVS